MYLHNDEGTPTMATATTPITPAIRTLLDDALTETIGEGGMFAEGSRLYRATLALKSDGAPLGDLIDVVDLFDLHDDDALTA